MELLSVQCLQVYGIIPILSTAVYFGFGRYGSQRFAWWHFLFDRCIKCIQDVVFSKVTLCHQLVGIAC